MEPSAFITVFTWDYHLSLLSQINPFHAPKSISLRFILILFCRRPLVFPRCLFPSGFPTQNCAYISRLPHTCHIPSPSHSFLLDHPNNVWWGRIIQFQNLGTSLFKKGSSHSITSGTAGGAVGIFRGLAALAAHCLTDTGLPHLSL